MKTINIQVGNHFITRLQERFHVKPDEMISTLNSNLNEGNLSLYETHLFFPLISGVVAIGKNVHNDKDFFAISIEYSYPNKHPFSMGKKFKRKINWYIKKDDKH